MANDITSRPWFMDTVGNVYLNRVWIGEMIWTSQVAAGDRLIISDKNGKVIIDSVADAPNDDQRYGKLGWVNGIVLTQIDSGKVLLFP